MKGGSPQEHPILSFYLKLFSSQSKKLNPLEEKNDATKNVLFIRNGSAGVQHVIERLRPTGCSD
jgi:hypothetical protein